MLKNVFVSNGPNGQRFSKRTLMGMLSAGSLSELETKHRELTAKVTKLLGRVPIESEMREGIRKPEPTREEVIEARRAQANAAYSQRISTEALYDPTQVRLRTALERAEEERRGKLTHIERELEDAQAAANAAQQRREDQQRRTEIKATASYRTLKEGIDNSLLVARLDPAISQGVVNALVTQSDQLERTMDLSAVRANVVQIQRAISGEIELRDAQLRDAVDRAALRRQMLASCQVWDDISVETLGQTEYVALTVNGETKRVTKATYDTRQSDEQLRNTLFATSEVVNA